MIGEIESSKTELSFSQNILLVAEYQTIISLVELIATKTILNIAHFLLKLGWYVDIEQFYTTAISNVSSNNAEKGYRWQ